MSTFVDQVCFPPSSSSPTTSDQNGCINTQHLTEKSEREGNRRESNATTTNNSSEKNSSTFNSNASSPYSSERGTTPPLMEKDGVEIINKVITAQCTVDTGLNMTIKSSANIDDGNTERVGKDLYRGIGKEYDSGDGGGGGGLKSGPLQRTDIHFVNFIHKNFHDCSSYSQVEGGLPSHLLARSLRDVIDDRMGVEHKFDLNMEELVQRSVADIDCSNRDGSELVQRSVTDIECSNRDGSELVQRSVTDIECSNRDGNELVQRSVTDIGFSTKDGRELVQRSVMDIECSNRDGRELVQRSVTDIGYSNRDGSELVQRSVTDIGCSNRDGRELVQRSVTDIGCSNKDGSNEMSVKVEGEQYQHDDERSSSNGDEDEDDDNEDLDIISSLNLLVVDDSLLQRKLSKVNLSGQFNQELWVVQTAPNGETALQYCCTSQSQPDVIIIDQNMESTGGQLLGSDVVTNLRQSYGDRDLIIIGCTGLGDGVKRRFLDAGCDAVWPKPMPTRKDAMKCIQRLRYAKLNEEMTLGGSFSGNVGVGNRMNESNLKGRAGIVTNILKEAGYNTGTLKADVLHQHNLLYSSVGFTARDWSHVPLTYIMNGRPTLIQNPAIHLLQNATQQHKNEDNASYYDEQVPPCEVVELTGAVASVSELSCSVKDIGSLKGDEFHSLNEHCLPPSERLQPPNPNTQLRENNEKEGDMCAENRAAQTDPNTQILPQSICDRVIVSHKRNLLSSDQSNCSGLSASRLHVTKKPVHKGCEDSSDSMFSFNMTGLDTEENDKTEGILAWDPVTAIATAFAAVEQAADVWHHALNPSTNPNP